MPTLALFVYGGGRIRGGAARALLSLANGLSGRGYDIHVVTTGTLAGRPTNLDPAVRLFSLGADGLRAAWRPLVGYLRANRPTALISAMEHPNVVAVATGAVSGAPTRVAVCTQGHLTRRLELSYGLRDRMLLPPLVRWAYTRADTVFAASEGVAEDLESYIRGRSRRTTAIHNPVVDDTFPARMQVPPPHPWLREQDVPVILNAGRLTRQKDQATLLRALSLIRRGSPARLLVLGDGRDRPQLERLTRALSLEDSVDFVGHVDDPLPYMAHADVFALSSLWEGFGNVLVESLACGTPVVSTDCPSGPAEILEGGRYGRLVPVGDAPALAEAIASTLADEPDRGLLAARARDFHVDTIAERYLAALRLPAQIPSSSR